MPEHKLKNTIAAILLAAGRPVKINELAKAAGSDKPAVEAAVEELTREFNGGIMVIRKDDRVQLATAPAEAKAVADFFNAEQRERLTDAAVETLAIVSYKQPITRAEIEAIRGVNSQYILRQLAIRGLVEKTTSQDDARRLVYRTTLDFMAHLGLTDMSQLPAFDELTKSVQLPETSETKPDMQTEAAQTNESDSNQT